MDPARSTYKTDYIPYDWMQNNFTSNAQDFCSSDNVDDCLRYISRVYIFFYLFFIADRYFLQLKNIL